MGKRGDTGKHLLGRCGPDAQRWNGGRTVNAGRVYLYEPEHPDANSRGYIAESRKVMEAMLGRRLNPDEVVRHRSDDKTDNRPENLILCGRADHLRRKGR